MSETIIDHKPIDKFIPWMFVAFFVVFASVDAVMVTLAIKTHSGVVNDQAYEQGLAYNDTLSKADKQATLGWSSSVMYQSGTLSARIVDKDGYPVTGASVELIMTRPIKKGMDFAVTLREQNAGEYSAAASFPASGQWNAYIKSVRGDDLYTINHMIMIP